MSIDRHAASKSRQAQRREEAIARQEASAKLSVPERLARLDALFGEGKGATKERLKLHMRAARGFTRPTAPAVPGVVIHGSDVVAAPAEPRQRQRRQRREEKRGS